MPIKLYGIILLILSFTMLGFYMSYKLRKRKTDISDILLFLNKLSTAIRYRTADIYTLINECTQGCLLSLNDQKDLITAVDKLAINKDEQRLLRAFFKEFGKSDIDGELSRIEYYKHIFTEQYEAAKSEIESKSKLYKMSGLFSGLAFAVILI